MSGLFGSNKPSKQTTTTQLGPEQKKIFSYAMPYLEDFAKNGVQLPTESGVAGFDPLQQQAQESAIGAALGSQTQLANKGLGASNFLLGDVLNPESNPALQRYMTGATDQITNNFLRNVMPSIRGEAITTGNFGSSGQGIATGLAAGEAANAVGNTQAQIANTGYGQGLNAMSNALNQLPSTMGAMLGPSSTLAAVGDVRQGLSQNILDEAQQRYMQQQMLPLTIGSQLMSILNGMPGGTTVSTGTAPQASPLMQMGGLGLALAGIM